MRRIIYQKIHSPNLVIFDLVSEQRSERTLSLCFSAASFFVDVFPTIFCFHRTTFFRSGVCFFSVTGYCSRGLSGLQLPPHSPALCCRRPCTPRLLSSALCCRRPSSPKLLSPALCPEAAAVAVYAPEQLCGHRLCPG